MEGGEYHKTVLSVHFYLDKSQKIANDICDLYYIRTIQILNLTILYIGP